MSLYDQETNQGDTTYQFSLNGNDFAVGGELSSQDPNNCIFIKDTQGLDIFDFQLLRQGLTIDLNENGGTSFVTSLDGSGPKATIVCDSVIENVFGGMANDIIHGNDFGNIIAGGKGGDELWGCGGQDTFKYDSVVASRPTPGHFDTIEDFVSGEDFIKLHTLDVNLQRQGHVGFHFSAAHHLTGHAGQLIVTNNNVVLGDVNGDGRADFKIVVHGDHVQHSDFIL